MDACGARARPRAVRVGARRAGAPGRRPLPARRGARAREPADTRVYRLAPAVRRAGGQALCGARARRREARWQFDDFGNPVIQLR